MQVRELVGDPRVVQRAAGRLVEDAVQQLAPSIVGPDALTGGNRWAFELLRARGNTIEGGTTEILKNIVAERVLGLPRLKGAA